MQAGDLDSHSERGCLPEERIVFDSLKERESETMLIDEGLDQPETRSQLA